MVSLHTKVAIVSCIALIWLSFTASLLGGLLL